MRVLVVYESMYGNTHQIAEAIGEGLSIENEVAVAPLSRARLALEAGPDLLIVGGPTHVHGLSRPRSRLAAVQQAEGKHQRLDPSAPGPGLGEWLGVVRPLPQTRWFAAFDARADAKPLLTG